MHYSNINFTVKSRRQADRLAEICAMYYDTAVVTSVGYIGGYFHDAPAVIRVGYENEHHDRLAWEKLVTTLIQRGYYDCIG